MDAGGLVERDRELSVLRDAMDAARQGAGRVIVIEGPPGIGKTSLLGAARELAGDRGAGSASARGVNRWSSGSPTGSCGNCWSRRSRRHRASFRVWRVRRGGSFGACRARELDEEPGSGDVLHHGLYWIVAGLAERRPLLVAVDDAQWGDAPSLRWLAALSRRLDELPVLLVVVARGGRSDARGGLDALAAAAGARRLEPEPLTPSAVGQLFESACRLRSTLP